VIESIRTLDPYKWLETRGFSAMKTADYLKTIECELRSSTVKHGCYETMVKSGEVYFDETGCDSRFMPGDDRPRNIMIGSS